MRALTGTPSTPHSLGVTDMPDPQPSPDELLVSGMAVGVCAVPIGRSPTDTTVGHHPCTTGSLGHESLGRVTRTVADSGFTEGDLVAGVVRRPDPALCGACARGALTRDILLENGAVVGSVNANLRHSRQAADALSRACPRWLSR